jgi:pyridinium-3,5-bisthiocarboxylic acid mononucleotide nickel chelatase
MRALYFDAFSGVSGDMTVGALLALGVPLSLLEEGLRGLPLGAVRLRSTVREVSGIRACKFDVDVGANVDAGQGGGPHEHEPYGGGHEHRSFREIRSMIEESRLAPEVRRRAVEIFRRLAVAEGKVHGVAEDDVTFHEVGAVDSIVDIVGTAIGFVELGVERVYVSTLPLGSGTVPSRHGTLPVPAPATVELLRGFPVRLGDGGCELVTPTGAAIVSTFATAGEPAPPLRVEAVGYGAGSRTLTDRPNLLRLLLGRIASEVSRDEMIVIETNIDDSSPEIYEHVIDELLAAGARDVWLTPVQMKKNRPGVVLHVLGEPGARELLASIVLSETSAIGVRFFPVERRVLRREQLSVETEFGSVQVKRSYAPDGSLNMAPEYESCRAVARERGVPLKSVYQAAVAAALRTK